MGEYTRWYRVGTAALTKNSKIVTGSGTFWLAAGLNPGDLFTVDASQFYEVDAINSNTQLTLKTAYSGDSINETAYSIVRNFTASLPAQVAAQTADLLNDFRRFVDTDMQSIHGKSAYQIACDKGFTGTESEWVASLKGDSAYAVAVSNGYTKSEAEWLESLKAAGEWAAASERLSGLEDTDSEFITKAGLALKNSTYRGKNLGPFTDAHYAEITSGRFTDMYIGDYFTIDSSHRYYIAGFKWLGIDMSLRGLALFPAQGITEAEAAPYRNTRQASAIGTEGEEGYIPSAWGEYQQTNWYVNLMPKFIEQIEGFFGASRVTTYQIEVPAGHFSDSHIISAEAQVISKAHLPTIGMVTGWEYMHNHQSSSHGFYHCQVQIVYPQLPLFRMNPSLMKCMCAETPYAAESTWGDAYVGAQPYMITWPNHGEMKGMVKPVFCIG